MTAIVAAASAEGRPGRTANRSRGRLVATPPGGRSSSTSGGTVWSSQTLRCVGSTSDTSSNGGVALRCGTGAVWDRDLTEPPPRSNPNIESAIFSGLAAMIDSSQSL